MRRAPGKSHMPSIIQAGPLAWAKMQEFFKLRGMTQAERLRHMLGMRVRPVKKIGRTKAQLEKQRRRRARNGHARTKRKA